MIRFASFRPTVRYIVSAADRSIAVRAQIHNRPHSIFTTLSTYATYATCASRTVSAPRFINGLRRSIYRIIAVCPRSGRRLSTRGGMLLLLSAMSELLDSPVKYQLCVP